MGTCTCNAYNGTTNCTMGGANQNYCPQDCHTSSMAPSTTMPKLIVEPPSTTTTTLYRRMVCLADWDPVCGSNGKIYSNSCYADAANTTYACKVFTDLGNSRCMCQ